MAVRTTHKMYSGTTFDSLPLGTKFKSTKVSYTIYKKVKPSRDPHQHNSISINASQTLYDWFDQEETVHVQQQD